MSIRPVFIMISIGLLFAVGAYADPDPEQPEHVVQPGQAAYGIAQQYGMTIAELRKLNPGRRIARLQSGEKLVIEDKRVAVIAAVAESEAASPVVAEPAIEAAPETPSHEPTAPTVSRKRKSDTSTRATVKVNPTATVSREVKEVEKALPPAGTAKIVEAPSNRPDKVAMLADLDKKPRQDRKGAGSVGAAVSMILKLGVVLVLAYLSILALKLFSVKRDALPRARSEMKVVDTVRLSSAGSVHLVEVRGKGLLLGCSPTGQVTLLQEFDPDEAEESEPESEAGTESKFARYLAAYSGQSVQNSPAKRVAGLLRDCADQLKNRRTNRSNQKLGDNHGA